jgi:hypothetical protein
MPLFGGAITDRLGVRSAAVLYSAVCTLGAAGFWLSLLVDVEPDTREART